MYNSCQGTAHRKHGFFKSVATVINVTIRDFCDNSLHYKWNVITFWDDRATESPVVTSLSDTYFVFVMKGEEVATHKMPTGFCATVPSYNITMYILWVNMYRNGNIKRAGAREVRRKWRHFNYSLLRAFKKIYFCTMIY